MSHELYNSFRNAGLERDASTLSTSQNGKRMPAIGHYVQIYDGVIVPSKESDQYENANRSRQDAANNIARFLTSEGTIERVRRKIPQYTPKSQVNTYEVIQDFINKTQRINA
jgi:hypothetical protein